MPKKTQQSPHKANGKKTMLRIFMPWTEITETYDTEAITKMIGYTIFWALVPCLIYFGLYSYADYDWHTVIYVAVYVAVQHAMMFQSGIQHRATHQFREIWPDREYKHPGYMINHRFRHGQHHVKSTVWKYFFISLKGIAFIMVLDAMIGTFLCVPFTAYFVVTSGIEQGMADGWWCYQAILTGITWWMLVFELGHLAAHVWWLQVPLAWDIVAPEGHRLHHVHDGVKFFTIYHSAADLLSQHAVRAAIEFQGHFEPAWLRETFLEDTAELQTAVTERSHHH